MVKKKRVELETKQFLKVAATVGLKLSSSVALWAKGRVWIIASIVRRGQVDRTTCVVMLSHPQKNHQNWLEETNEEE